MRWISKVLFTLQSSRSCMWFPILNSSSFRILKILTHFFVKLEWSLNLPAKKPTESKNINQNCVMVLFTSFQQEFFFMINWRQNLKTCSISKILETTHNSLEDHIFCEDSESCPSSRFIFKQFPNKNYPLNKKNLKRNLIKI